MQSSKLWCGLFGCVLATQLMACGAPDVADEGETLDSVEQAFGQAQCNLGEPVHTAGAVFKYLSPGYYGTACMAVDVAKYSTSALWTSVSWRAAIPDYITDCQNSYVRVLHYNGAASGAWLIAGDFVQYGVWKSGRCSFPDIELDSVQMVRNSPQRLATTARRYYSATDKYSSKEFELLTKVGPK